MKFQKRHIDMEDFLADLSKMPVSEVCKRYNTTHEKCQRYAAKYGIKLKKKWGDFNSSTTTNNGFIPDVSELTYTVRPKHNNPPLNQTCLYR